MKTPEQAENHRRWDRWRRNLNKAWHKPGDDIPDHLKFQRYANYKILGSTSRPPELTTQEAPEKETLRGRFREKLGDINSILKKEETA